MSWYHIGACCRAETTGTLPDEGRWLGNCDPQALSNWAAGLECSAPPYLYLGYIEVRPAIGALLGVSAIPQPREPWNQSGKVHQTYPLHQESSLKATRGASLGLRGSTSYCAVVMRAQRTTYS